MMDKKMSDQIRRFADEAVRIQTNNENKLKYVMMFLRELKDAKNSGSDEQIAKIVHTWDTPGLLAYVEEILCEK